MCLAWTAKKAAPNPWPPPFQSTTRRCASLPSFARPPVTTALRRASRTPSTLKNVPQPTLPASWGRVKHAVPTAIRPMLAWSSFWRPTRAPSPSGLTVPCTWKMEMWFTLVPRRRPFGCTAALLPRLPTPPHTVPSTRLISRRREPSRDRTIISCSRRFTNSPRPSSTRCVAESTLRPGVSCWAASRTTLTPCGDAVGSSSSRAAPRTIQPLPVGSYWRRCPDCQSMCSSRPTFWTVKRPSFEMTRASSCHSRARLPTRCRHSRTAELVAPCALASSTCRARRSRATPTPACTFVQAQRLGLPRPKRSPRRSLQLS
mmetsp:Transcript_5918/g.19319  ORF Transcript_5918/g.19319 Transcript_5918/m.19319 type:complete len:316 (-) Transcript_5918:625-1572(-)